MKPQMLTVNEVAAWLRCHPSSIYRMVKKGQLRSFKVGSDYRFIADEVAKLMDNGVTQEKKR